MSTSNLKRVSIMLMSVVALVTAWLNLPSTPTTLEDAQIQSGIIEKAYKERKSDIVVHGQGTIRSILKDDNQGSRHQRFIVGLASGHTILIAHNIDLAKRVVEPRKGRTIAFKGEYEWNDRGGVIHWTHRDPDGDHPDGWLEYQGKKYW